MIAQPVLLCSIELLCMIKFGLEIDGMATRRAIVLAPGRKSKPRPERFRCRRRGEAVLTSALSAVGARSSTRLRDPCRIDPPRKAT